MNILNNLDDDEIINNMSDDEEDDEETSELIAAVEAKEEAVIEQFLEIAYTAKNDQVEALKAVHRKNKDQSKDEQRKEVKDLQAAMDALRKKGIKQIKAYIATHLERDDITLRQKLAILNSSETAEKIEQLSQQFCTVDP